MDAPAAITIPATHAGLTNSTAPVRRVTGGGPDRAFKSVTGGAALLVFLLLMGIAASTLWGGRLAFAKFGFGFLSGTTWDPNAGTFGALVPIFGTLVSSFLALLIAVPTSFGIATFLAEVAPRWLRSPIAIAVELLAAVPSIIYGMWGLFVFAPYMALHAQPWLIAHLGPLPVVGALFQGAPIGVGMLTAGIVLAVMIIPFISAVMRDVFQGVPPALRESAFALGATPWEVVARVTLPYTKSAVVGAIFLGLGRALGETMAVTFIIGNSFDFSTSLLAPGTSIAAAIANQFAEADSPLFRSSLIALGFVLFVITFIVLALAKLMLQRLARAEGKGR